VSARDVVPDWTDDDEARLRADLERSGIDPDQRGPSDEIMRRVVRVFVGADRDRVTPAPDSSTIPTDQVQNGYPDATDAA
jgi:hypothetical protein